MSLVASGSMSVCIQIFDDVSQLNTNHAQSAQNVRTGEGEPVDHLRGTVLTNEVESTNMHQPNVWKGPNAWLEGYI